MGWVAPLRPRISDSPRGQCSALIGASVILWLTHILILRGVKEAAALNTIATVAKIVPLVIFIGFVIISFNAKIFTANFWGGEEPNFRDIYAQVRSTMLLTVFVFVGIEGASVYSRYAKNRNDVGVATVLGFLGVLSLLVMVTILSYGVLLRPGLAALRTPSMAGVMAALWTSNILIQLFLIVTPFAESAFTLILKMTSVMTLVPYFLVAVYGWQLAWKGGTYDANPRGRKADFVRGAVATLYAAGMIYAGGLKLLLLSAILYTLGSILFILARREQQENTFASA